MNLPRLNLKLILEARQETADGAGGFDRTWSELGTVWGMQIKNSGREQVEAGQPLASQSSQIIVRAAPFGTPMRPVPGQRLRHDGRIFMINAVGDWDQNGRYLCCFAKEEHVQ